MLKGHLDTSYKRDCQLHLYQIDDDIKRYNDPVYRPLTVGINGVTNSTEEKINQATSFSYHESKKSTGWLRSLLTGVAVLVGTGTLAVGGYFCYMAGRAGSTGSALFSYPVRSLAIAASPSVVLANGQQIVDDSTRIPAASRSPSPYSYYENRNSAASKPSETIIKDNYYPLDSENKRELARFCLENVHGLVIKSYQAEPKYKCELLGEVIDKMLYYKNMDSTLQEINSGRENLAPEEKNNVIFIRRKLTTLYLAAETIISGKDTLHFHINAMRDDKKYLPEELIEREKIIIGHFATQLRIKEC